MFVIIGIVVVIGAILAGYLMEHGPIKVLMQPAELIIIAGAALGTLLIGNPLHILKDIFSGFLGVFGGSKYSKQQYLDTLKNAARRLMQLNGLGPDQVSQVRGFASQRLRESDALDPSNRRISLIVQYLKKAPEDASKEAGQQGVKPTEGGEVKTKDPNEKAMQPKYESGKTDPKPQ
jgi:hypothetical protein